MKLSYLDLKTTDPAFNLAAEQYVFDSLPRDRMYFMLWQNDNAIIVGKHQNTMAEIDQSFVDSHGIRVVRRLSGGGAVYHDLGNLNFTFITDSVRGGKLDFRLFCQPVIRVLTALGVPAELNGRNDMVIGGQKFSGNSQYLRGGRVMHHGTILFDSDLSVVSRALRVDPEKIRGKGIPSVRSRVTNVKPCLSASVTLEDFRGMLLDEILRANPGEPYVFTEEDLRQIDTIRQERYAVWEWNYGFSPACSMVKKRRIEGCGTVEVYLQIENGVITQASFRGDYFCIVEPEPLARLLRGARPERRGYCDALKNVDAGRYISGLRTSDLIELLSE